MRATSSISSTRSVHWIWRGCFARATVNVTSPVPPAMSSTSAFSSMGAWRIMPASHVLYAPKLETALNRSYFFAMVEKMSFTRSDEMSAGASLPVAVSMLTGDAPLIRKIGRVRLSGASLLYRKGTWREQAPFFRRASV